MQQAFLDDKFNQSNTLIKHLGSITKIDKNSLTISLLGIIHCESCQAKKNCSLADSNLQEIIVEDNSRLFKLHETVEVIIQKNTGLKAVFWSYVLPFLILMSSLIITTHFMRESIAGIISLLMLIPYYLFLYFFNPFFKKDFKIAVLKINNNE